LLRKNFFSTDQLAAIVKDFRSAGLPAEEVALMSFAQKITTRANQVSAEDINELHAYGLSDEEILDVILTCTARNFFSKTLDAVGAVPDEVFLGLEQGLLEVLTPGRPFP
jgi:alkylhydroperoxidase family enzyme